MGAHEFREILTREPFEPFRIRLSSGDSYEIRDPQAVALMRNRLFVALPDGDRWVFIPFLHVAAVEAVTNGRARRASGRKRRR